MSNTTLFTLSKSWHESTWIYEQLAFASKGDTILFIQDAVLALQSPISLASFVAKCDSLGVAVMALQDDCRLRGVENQYPRICLIGYQDFVDLVIKHNKQVSW